jgi:hypothetical protein
MRWQILALWGRPVASRVALDLPNWAMCAVLHRNIDMTIEMTSEGGVCDGVDVVNGSDYMSASPVTTFPNLGWSGM